MRLSRVFALMIFAALVAGPGYAADEKTEAANPEGEKGAIQEQAQPEVPKEPLPIKGSKRTVMFPHDKGHEKIECVVCHHKVNEVQTFAKCSDPGCHDNLVEKKGEHSLYYVMHSKAEDLKHQTCMSCHLKTVAEKPDLKKQLTGCSGSACHPKAAKKDDSKDDSKDGAAPEKDGAASS